VTMIVKSIEREIVAKLKKHPEFDISPSIIMSYFNKTMKKLLYQGYESGMINTGFDGGILYYNKREQIIKFTGAQTPLFYVDTTGQLNVIKGDRYSVGYKNCDSEYRYKEYILPVNQGMKFFISTDGYFDQNGGSKGFPFGKKKFMEIINKHHTQPMHRLKNIFLDENTKWRQALQPNEQSDDMTVIGFEIGKRSEIKDLIIDEIFQYEGVITQNVLAAAMDNIEQIKNLSLVGKISIATIELCQNMMNYSKNAIIGNRDIVSHGYIEIQYYKHNFYIIIAKNIVSIEDKIKLTARLNEIKSLDKNGIKKRYRELRKTGEHTHQKGGGIGLYEIAKISDKIKYEFEPINEDKYYFTMRVIIKEKKSKSS